MDKMQDADSAPRFPLVPAPAKSTVHAVLDRNGSVERRKRRRHKAEGTPLSDATTPNGLWCADFKGEFMLGNRKYCYPLTITDYSSRYLLACEGLESTQSTFAFAIFERTFKQYGLPRAIRTDNGVPFASPNALFGLSRSPCGGCAWASISNASSRATLSRMADTNACI
jgi:transposase InsO family protein